MDVEKSLIIHVRVLVSNTSAHVGCCAIPEAQVMGLMTLAKVQQIRILDNGMVFQTFGIWSNARLLSLRSWDTRILLPLLREGSFDGMMCT